MSTHNIHKFVGSTERSFGVMEPGKKVTEEEEDTDTASFTYRFLPFRIRTVNYFCDFYKFPALWKLDNFSFSDYNFLQSRN